ncbi:hypothetical protein A4G99_07020 [Haladaptatus sp. R4]|uniref:hypothetical protein n=1 Tax=Haladaptatus sp. R4 TaxID=1679489 RepID=UPI0007B47C0E|nr:hypothetical protein [Haladaptatus sp. R4]KZN24187.1 hypothetical protein A4G99_07020 [Haladaptatus sp. R4]
MPKKVISIKVGESVKDEWQQHVEGNPEVESVSHLIRLSVNKEIHGGHESPEKAVQSSTDSKQLGEVVEGLSKLQDSVEGVQERLTAIEKEKTVTQNKDIQSMVFGMLPTCDRPKEGATVEDLASNLEESREDVEEALLDLLSITGQIQHEVVNGTERWWKKE